MAESDKMGTAEKRATFIVALSQGFSVTGAANWAELNRTSLYELKKRDENFSTAWDEALDEGSDYLEDEARHRAVEGTTVPKTVAGKREEVTQYSDTLLIFLLKARRPGKFRDNFSVEHRGSAAHPLEVAGLDRIMEQWMGRNGNREPDRKPDAPE